MKELYISVDIESDGPIPGEYSMLSLGSVALDKSGKIHGKFYEKIKTLPGAKKHPETMKFWKNNLEAYKEATKNPKPPAVVMNNYFNWLKKMESKTKSRIVLVGWPIAFDYMFISWYLGKFVKKLKTLNPLDNPIGFNGVDVKSFIWAHLRKPTYKGFIVNSNEAPKKWFENVPVDLHNALADALEQGLIFVNVLKENQRRKK